jgi:PAS domain S-box-containing protein
MSSILNSPTDFWAEVSSKCFRWPSVRELLYLLVVISAGLVGNHLNIELFFGVNFIFGSVATMFAVRTSGTLWGTLVGIVIGSYTYFLWGQPYAIIIFGLEAFIVGLAIGLLKKENMILIDIGYWFFIGLPLVWIFYSYPLGIEEPAVTLIALKQMANGVINVVLACFLIQFTPLTRRISLKGFVSPQKSLPMYSTINTLLAVFILLPMLAVTIVSGQIELDKIQTNMQYVVKDKAKYAGRDLSATLHYYSSILESTAALALDEDKLESWENTVKSFGKHVIPGLLNTEIISADGEILFSYPEQLYGISEHANDLSSISPDNHYLSSDYDDHKGTHFTMIVPISGGHFLAGSFSPKVFVERLRIISLDGQHIELIDDQGTVLAVSDAADLSGFVEGISPNHLLPPNVNLPTMVRSKQAYWQDTATFMHQTDWIIRVAVPMKEPIELMQDDYKHKFLTMLIISVVALLLSPFVSNYLSIPLKGITLAADMYAQRVERTDVIWPRTNIEEVNSLIYQFQSFVMAINEKQLTLSLSKAKHANIASELTQFIDTANTPIFGIDAQGNVNEWNQQTEKITGFTKAEVMGRDLVADFITDDFKVSVGEVLDGALNGEETSNYEFPLFTQYGDRVDVLLNSTTRRNASGQIVGVVGVGQDITELNKVRVEQESERKEATAQIIQTSKLATLGEMATSVAHELNQPLNVIRMAAGNIQRKMSKGLADPEYLTNKLIRIEDQTTRAAAIIDHMRMFGRKAKEKPESIDPRKVVTNALDLMGEQLRLAEIKIETAFPDDCSSVLGHTIQLEQVILNLLRNSMDAMAEKGGGAKIILRVFEDDKGVYITSEDTGGGIPEDILLRIFEPFYTSKEMGKGTGLGLSVSYGIVRDMNGTVVGENIGEGARFTITLPRLS